jgi:hypothetical protein
MSDPADLFNRTFLICDEIIGAVSSASCSAKTIDRARKSSDLETMDRASRDLRKALWQADVMIETLSAQIAKERARVWGDS